MKLFVAALPGLVMLAACGSHTDAVTANGAARDSSDAQQVSARPPAPALTSQQFVDVMASTDAYEIEAGKLAEMKGTTPGIKDFGKMMVRAHSDSTARLREVAAANKPAIIPNVRLSARQEANLTALRDTTGADFDMTYRSQQTAVHQKAIMVLEGYATKGQIPALKEWAAATAPVARGHLDQILGI